MRLSWLYLDGIFVESAFSSWTASACSDRVRAERSLPSVHVLFAVCITGLVRVHILACKKRSTGPRHTG
eukprot:1790394-Amphidinium_carterae.1